MNQLLCGAAERVITPSLGVKIPGYFRVRVSDGVKTDLKAHAIVLNDGDTRLAIIHLDIICFQASLAKAIRKRLWEQLQIPADCVMLAATHTHTGGASNYRDLCTPKLPKDELERLIEKTVAAVADANRRAVPVTMHYAFGEEKTIAFNRNYWMTDGSIVTNPGKRRPFEVVRPVSPIDHTLGVIRFDTLDGTPVAQLVNFACHPDTVGGTAFCADYPGELCSLQQEHFGADFVTVYLNGASGNVNHLNAEWYKTPGFALDRSTHYHYMGEVLSRAVCGLHGQLEQADDVTLDAISKTYRTARRQPNDADMQWVADVYADPKAATADDLIYARELTLLHKHPKRYATVEIQAFRIGPCAVATLPCEAYADIALSIRKESPFEHLMITSLTNGYLGYVVTEPAFSAGVYESKLSLTNSFLPPKAADEMAECAVKLLHTLQ